MKHTEKKKRVKKATISPNKNRALTSTTHLRVPVVCFLSLSSEPQCLGNKSKRQRNKQSHKCIRRRKLGSAKCKSKKRKADTAFLVGVYSVILDRLEYQGNNKHSMKISRGIEYSSRMI